MREQVAGDWYAERGAHRVSKKRQANGEKLILWTSRNEEQTKEAVEWCKKYGLIFDAVNDNLPEIVEAFGGNCRKIFANEYIDDRNRSIGSCREKSSMERWAENEVAIACRREKPDRKDGEWDYGCACYESALKALALCVRTVILVSALV